MKYIKHHLSTIEGVEIFPIIAFLLFFVLFIAFIIMVFRMDKKIVVHIKNLPLDSPDSTQSTKLKNNEENIYQKGKAHGKQ